MNIERPQSPSVSCNPTGHVPENNDISCTCTTGSVGLPVGRLIWIRASDVNNPITVGNNGDLSLVMTPQTLTRADHNHTTFRCDVEWIQNVTGQTYTVLVGYAPTQPTLTLSSFTVSENQTLNFYCQADGRPTPNVALVHQDSGAVLAKQSSPLSWGVSRGRCEESGEYICTAGNAMGPDTHTNVTVYVMCAPREVPVSSVPADTLVLNYQGSPVARVINLMSYPAPSSSAFSYIGLDRTSYSPERDVTAISFNVICKQRSQPLYIVTCALIVDNVTSAAAVGFYRLALTNDRGSVDFVFQVTLNGNPQVPGCPFPAAAVAGAVTAAGVLVAITLVVCVVLYRKYSRQKQDSSESPLPGQQDDSNYTGLTVFEEAVSNNSLNIERVNTYETPLPRQQAESSTYTGLVFYEDIENPSRNTITDDTAGTKHEGFRCASRPTEQSKGKEGLKQKKRAVPTRMTELSEIHLNKLS